MIQLFTQKALAEHKKKDYKYLHIGAVQVGIQPLTRNGLKASVFVALRDCRHRNFEDSILGLVESSLCNGPIHFECFPNFPVSLNDPGLLKALTLNVKAFLDQTLISMIKTRLEKCKKVLELLAV